jgi:signal transduction histidine kinase
MNKRTENRMEILFIVSVIIVTFVISSHLDIFEILIDLSVKYEKYELDELIVVIMISGIITIPLLIGKFLQVNKLNKKLELLNKNLEDKVRIQVKKQREQERILIEQSKNAAMGEMIGNIAHQWRQPLNALGLILQNIKFSYELDEITDEFMSNSMKKADLLTKTMSKTIDDFRNFFKPNKMKEQFYVEEIINKSVDIVKSTFKNNYIEILLEQEKELKLFAYPNELSQVILNILNNSRDAIEENKIENPVIRIESYKKNNFIVIKINDNANGIPDDLLSKIFEPYFTTKIEGKGTGIGLYMSKIIIEENMSGKISVINKDNGVEFVIKIPINSIKENI